jgi:hypothetical protein
MRSPFAPREQQVVGGYARIAPNNRLQLMKEIFTVPFSLERPRTYISRREEGGTRVSLDQYMP